MSLMDNLLNLFRVDAQVRGLRSRLESAQRYLQAQSRQYDILEQQRQELLTRKKHLQATTANMEMEIKSTDQRLEKLRNELNSASTNKQYGALLNEVNTVKTGRGQIEDRMLTDMEQIEKIDGDLTALESQIAERVKVRDIAKAQLAERQGDVGQRLAELEVERQAAAAIISPKALAVFDEMANCYEGEAMAVVEEINRRDREYACGACNMHVPFELVANLTSTSESLLRCPACSRILYMQAEMRGTLAKK